MARRLAWQRGAIDMVTVGVSMLILSIVMAGTTASIVWSRDALTHQEHYKAAAYILRGKMEAWQAGIQLIAAARDGTNPGSFLRRTEYAPVQLDLINDRGGVKPVYVYVSVDSVTVVDLQNTGEGIDFYRVTMSARWTERPFAGGGPDRHAMERKIVLKTSVAGRATLG